MMNADNSTAAITKAKIASTSSITFKVPSFRETYQLDGSAQAERQDALTVPVIEILYTLHSHYHRPNKTDQRRCQKNRPVTDEG